MRRRLFDDLVVSRTTTARTPSMRTLPLSLAVHAMAVAALVTLSVKAVREEPVQASTVVFHPSPRPAASAAPLPAHAGRFRAPQGTDTPHLVMEAPRPVITDIPAADIQTDVLDAPIGNVPICLSGCAPADPGDGADGPGLSGTEGGGEGSGPPRRVGGDIQEPRRIRGAAPVYPDLARRAGVSGKVVLECVIAEDGRVRDLKIVTGNPLLADAAVEAVRQWVYTPTRLNGEAVSVILTVTVRFGLGRIDGQGGTPWR